MGRHTDSERPSDSTHVEVKAGYKMHEQWESEQDIEVLREALRWQGSVTAVQSDLIEKQGAALREIKALYETWEQAFTGVGKLHDTVQDHVSLLRGAVENNLGEDWY